jgi:hypothetical protein
MKLLSKEGNVNTIEEDVENSFVRMDVAPLAEVIAFLTVSENRQLQQGDSLKLKPTPLEMDPQAYQLYIMVLLIQMNSMDLVIYTLEKVMEVMPSRPEGSVMTNLMKRCNQKINHFLTHQVKKSR